MLAIAGIKAGNTNIPVWIDKPLVSITLTQQREIQLSAPRVPGQINSVRYLCVSTLPCSRLGLDRIVLYSWYSTLVEKERWSHCTSLTMRDSISLFDCARIPFGVPGCMVAIGAGRPLPGPLCSRSFGKDASIFEMIDRMMVSAELSSSIVD